MIDKNLVKNSFKKNLKTYDENACVQKDMAEKLIKLLSQKSFESILEIGMGTGLLTKLIVENIYYNEYYANDIVSDCKKYLKHIAPDATFVKGDIEELKLDKKFDLIISNATLQWVSDIEKLSEKINTHLNENGLFVFSTFGKENFIELKELTGIGLEYYSLDELKEIFQADFEIIELKEEKNILYFKSFRDILKHIKLTGVNGVCCKKMSFLELRSAEKKYKELFSTDEGLRLTYNPISAVFKKYNIKYSPFMAISN